MQFSEKTLTILKNFSTINQSIVLNSGSELKTISPQKTVMAMATIEDVIPSQAVIYDLSRFLSVHSLYEKPEIEFGEKNFTISDGRRKTKYVYADISMVISPPEKEITIPSADVEVTVEWKDLQSVLKASGVLQLPEIAFVGRDGKCHLSAIDSANPTADTFGVELGDTNDDFSLIIKTENIKLMPNDYKVSLSSKGISKFETENTRYFIAVDSKSTYKKG